MHVAIVFPPVTDPRGPHLAPAALAAHLRRSGIRTTLVDADLGGLLYLLAAERIAASVDACRERLAGTPDEEEAARLRSALRSSNLALRIGPRAPGMLRDPEAFYRPDLHRLARGGITAALRLASAASGAVTCNIEPVEYAVRGYDPARLRDLAAVTADPALNLYDRYFREEVIPALEADRPDVVGVSILNVQQIIPGLRLARLLKERGHFVVIGGTVYAKFVPELLTRPAFFRLFCDGLIAYEGETALVELARQLVGERNLAAVPNLLHLDREGRVVMGPVLVEDVDALPAPDFDGLPLGHYLTPAPVLPILTGKGCYFNRCKFCDIPSINSIAPKAYRVRAPELVAADVAALNRKHGARHFTITDEALAPSLLLRLGEALERYPGLDTRFVGYARLERGFTPEVCARLFRMGMRKLFFGLESGSQAMLDQMEKGIRVEDARAVLRNCAGAGLAFHVVSMLGLPEEMEEQARETLRFFVEMAPQIGHPRNSFDIHPFGLDLRTDYYTEAGRYGIELDAADARERDFRLGALNWRNTRGLDAVRVEELLHAFHQELRPLLPAQYPHPNSIWPAHEEYALLYADHYEHRLFPPTDV